MATCGRYIAVFRKAEHSDYGVEFLDVPGCFSAGSDFCEAQAMASEALQAHLNLLASEGEPAPTASSLSDIALRLEVEGLLGSDFFALVGIE